MCVCTQLPLSVAGDAIPAVSVSGEVWFSVREAVSVSVPVPSAVQAGVGVLCA